MILHESLWNGFQRTRLVFFVSFDQVTRITHKEQRLESGYKGKSLEFVSEEGCGNVTVVFKRSKNHQ